MRPSSFPASLLIVLLTGLACVDPGDRTPDSADLRDPWVLPVQVDDPVRSAGKQIFASCASCHLADAGGRPDGSIPRLAGQLSSILEWRLQALADGSDDLPVMTPFARALTDSERREVAAYLASLPRPERVGLGSGTQRERGAEVYAGLCVGCHAQKGMGQSSLNAPRLCGQHAAYLVRRMEEMAGGTARSGDPAMKVIAASLPLSDRRAVSDYLARSRCE